MSDKYHMVGVVYHNACLYHNAALEGGLFFLDAPTVIPGCTQWVHPGITTPPLFQFMTTIQEIWLDSDTSPLRTSVVPAKTGVLDHTICQT